MQQIPVFWQDWSDRNNSCLKYTLYTGRRKECVNFKTDTDNFQDCCVPLPKQFLPQTCWNWSKFDRVPVSLGKTSLYIELHWHFFQAVHCNGRNNWTLTEQTPSRLGVLFLMSFFWIYPRLEVSFDHNSVRKNPFLSGYFCRISRFFYVRRTKNLSLMEPLVMATRIWSSYSVISNFLDYIKNYLMLLKPCGHIKVKGLATFTWLDDDQLHFSLVAWQDYSCTFTRNSFCLPFSSLSTFEAVFLALYSMLSWQIETL